MTAVTVKELAYIRLQAPDLARAEDFFNAFGLMTRERLSDRIYFRSHGAEHRALVVHRGERRLLSIAFEVDEEALITASTLDGASPVSNTEEPGGGRRVTLSDPDGNLIELVAGVDRFEPIAVHSLELNHGEAGRRRVNVVVRPSRTPSRVLRLGHIVLRTPDVSRLSAWYRRTLGLLESDDVFAPDGEEIVMSFVRLDHGFDPVDHHVMQFLKGDARRVHHISFEVQGIDDLYVGHEVLRSAGYEHVWGIGRHLQGSQIFDYWRDPFGVMYEHWTDSDRLDATITKGSLNITEMHGAWGPEPPASFRTQATS